MGGSPERIAGRPGRDQSEHVISHGSICRYIHPPRTRGETSHYCLRRTKASRGRRDFKRRREPIENRRSVHERPQAVENREQFDPWEGDLTQFRTQRGNLLTLSEQVSLPDHGSIENTNGIIIRDTPRKTDLSDAVFFKHALG